MAECSVTAALAYGGFHLIFLNMTVIAVDRYLYIFDPMIHIR
jgi:hypothetical protein